MNNTEVLGVIRKMAGEALAFREVNGRSTPKRECSREARNFEDENALAELERLFQTMDPPRPKFAMKNGGEEGLPPTQKLNATGGEG